MNKQSLLIHWLSQSIMKRERERLGNWEYVHACCVLDDAQLTISWGVNVPKSITMLSHWNNADQTFKMGLPIIWNKNTINHGTVIVTKTVRNPWFTTCFKVISSSSGVFINVRSWTHIAQFYYCRNNARHKQTIYLFVLLHRFDNSRMELYVINLSHL